jgi:hypothetical protein
MQLIETFSELEIAPEPTPDERAAIATALSVLSAEQGRADPWWEAGLAETLELTAGHEP